MEQELKVQAPESPRLVALRARLERAAFARDRALERACTATARLSECEEKESAIRAAISAELAR
jgi:hypothetical protein